MSCRAPDDAHPLVVITAAGTIAGNSVLNGHTDGQTVELEYALPGPDGAPMPAGRLVPDDIAVAPSWRNLRFARSQDSRRRRRGSRCRRGPFVDAGRLDRRHPAARARAAIASGVRRLDAAGADGLGGGTGVPVPAADAARQRGDRGARSSGSRRTTPPRSRTPTPGRTAATAGCSASPICCCGQHVMATYLSGTGAATGDRCASSTPSSTRNPRRSNSAPRREAGCGSPTGFGSALRP